MPSISLRPDGDSSPQVWTVTGASNAWEVIDDDPDSPNDSDFISTTTATSGSDFDCEVTLSATPANFLSALTGISDVVCRLRVAVSGWSNDIYALQIFLVNNSDVAITNTATVVSNSNQSITTGNVNLTLNATGLANNNKSMWDNARLVIRAVRTSSMGADTITTTVYAVEININYLPLVRPTQRPYMSYHPASYKIHGNYI